MFKSKDDPPGIKLHRVTVGGAGQSATLNLPSVCQDITVLASGAAARLYFDAADEAANLRFFEVPAGVMLRIPGSASPVILQGQGAGTIYVATTHPALGPADSLGEDYVAA